MKRSVLFFLLTATALTACDLAPDFMRPEVEVPAAFKEVSASDTSPITDGAWQKANPDAVAQFAKGDWWKVFGDDTLNGLVDQAHANSPTLEAARERLNQARSQTRVEESNLYPTIDAGLGATRQQQSPANPFIPPGTPLKPYTQYNANAAFDYGLDIFGKARNNAYAAKMREEEQEQTYRAARITLEADVAEAYYTLRSLRAEEKVLTDTLKLRDDTVNITKKRYTIGDVSDLEVARSETEQATTKSDLLAVQQQRAIMEHRLAILVGKPPASFSLTTTDILQPPPAIPAGLPSTLLERRPDVNSAEREMAATNAEIGLARAAFFPSIDLAASGGFQSTKAGDLFKWSSRTWLLGPLSGTELTVPIFEGGRNVANLALSKASFRESVANYRAQVLVAFKEAEDALSGVHAATEQVKTQDDAANASQRAYKIAKDQYDNGFIAYIDEIDTQRSLLAAQRGQVQARGQAYVATITLVRALGGGWDVPQGMEQPAPATPAEATPTPEGRVQVPSHGTPAIPAVAPAEPQTATPDISSDVPDNAAPAAEAAPAQEDSAPAPKAEEPGLWDQMIDFFDRNIPSAPAATEAPATSDDNSSIVIPDDSAPAPEKAPEEPVTAPDGGGRV